MLPGGRRSSMRRVVKTRGAVPLRPRHPPRAGDASGSGAERAARTGATGRSYAARVAPPNSGPSREPPDAGETGRPRSIRSIDRPQRFETGSGPSFVRLIVPSDISHPLGRSEGGSGSIRPGVCRRLADRPPPAIFRTDAAAPSVGHSRSAPGRVSICRIRRHRPTDDRGRVRRHPRRRRRARGRGPDVPRTEDGDPAPVEGRRRPEPPAVRARRTASTRRGACSAASMRSSAARRRSASVGGTRRTTPSSIDRRTERTASRPSSRPRSVSSSARVNAPSSRGSSARRNPAAAAAWLRSARSAAASDRAGAQSRRIAIRHGRDGPGRAGQRPVRLRRPTSRSASPAPAVRAKAARARSVRWPGTRRRLPPVSCPRDTPLGSQRYRGLVDP